MAAVRLSARAVTARILAAGHTVTGRILAADRVVTGGAEISRGITGAAFPRVRPGRAAAG
jgi:hypothetical protein